MSLLLLMSLVTQCGIATTMTGPSISMNKPIISVTGEGKSTLSVKATEYTLILYADTYADDAEDARKDADAMRKEIVEITKKLGGKEDDVVLTNLNTLEPIEGDPYFRVEQDIQISLKKVKDINKIKEKYLLIDGTQIGSLTPVISNSSDYNPAIAKARKIAVKNAKESATALAMEMGVTLGEPLYVSESVTYPTYSEYEAAEDSEIIVTVFLQYEMIYKK